MFMSSAAKTRLFAIFVTQTVSMLNDDENLGPQAYLTQQTSSTGVALLLPKDTK